DERAARDVALPAESALSVQHAQFDQHAGAAQADRAGQRDAHPPVGLPPPYAGQPAGRQGDGRPGSGDAEALSRHRADALRGAAARRVQHRSGRGGSGDPVVPAPAVGRKRDQVRRLAAGGRRADQPFGATRRPTASLDRIRHRPGIARQGHAGNVAGRNGWRWQHRFDRRRSRQHSRSPGPGVWRRSRVRYPHSARRRLHRGDRDTVRARGGRRRPRGRASETLSPANRYSRARPAAHGTQRMTIRTILVDDEKLAIQGLQLRLDKFPDVEVIATCANGREAIRKIKTEKPDLVFLDIQMPGFDGFSVVSGVMEIEPPLFVFVTAYEEHAIRAFEANAVNYLMKPVDEDKLADTVDRVRSRLAEKRSAE